MMRVILAAILVLLLDPGADLNPVFCVTVTPISKVCGDRTAIGDHSV